jgi:hypothetical protein
MRNFFDFPVFDDFDDIVRERKPTPREDTTIITDMDIRDAFEKGVPFHPQHVVETLIPEGIVLLYGPRGIGKTFLALDIALSLGYGLPALGRFATSIAPVVYIMGEGSPHSRVMAYQHARKVSDRKHRVAFITTPIDLGPTSELSQAVNSSMNKLEAWGVGLVVIDPLVSCITGLDENSQRDMSSMLQTIRCGSSATLIVHHTGHDTSRPRGSSVLESVADAVISVKREGSGLRVESRKVRDGAPFAPLRCRLKPVQVPHPRPGDIAAFNRFRADRGEPPVTSIPPLGSCVLELVDQLEKSTAVPRSDIALSALTGLGAATLGEWQRASAIPETTLRRRAKQLIAGGHVTKTGDVYVASSPPALSGSA